VDVLLAWEAASPLDDSPCRGYSHLYGLRLQVCWRVACNATIMLGAHSEGVPWLTDHNAVL